MLGCITTILFRQDAFKSKNLHRTTGKGKCSELLVIRSIPSKLTWSPNNRAKKLDPKSPITT